MAKNLGQQTKNKIYLKTNNVNYLPGGKFLLGCYIEKASNKYCLRNLLRTSDLASLTALSSVWMYSIKPIPLHSVSLHWLKLGLVSHSHSLTSWQLISHTFYKSQSPKRFWRKPPLNDSLRTGYRERPTHLKVWITTTASAIPPSPDCSTTASTLIVYSLIDFKNKLFDTHHIRF